MWRNITHVDLRRYFLSLPNPAARTAFAERAGTTKLYVHQLISRSDKSRRKASVALARKLSAASDGVVPLHEIRADIWTAP